MDRVHFTQMKEGTREEYAFLTENEVAYTRGTADRLLRALQDLDESLSGYQVTRLGHSLQSATRAWRDGADIDWVRVDAAETRRIRGYLAEIAKVIRDEGISVSHRVTLGTDPAAEILDQEEKVKANMVVMTSRGRSPIARWVFGSTSEKVLREGNLPLIVVRKTPE